MSGIQVLSKGINAGKIKIITTAEQEKALRDALHTEIENKSKACSNRTYDCTIPRIDGYDFCIRHILQDSRAPYKQCAYIYSNNKKCVQAAPKHDIKKDSALTNFCFEHSRLMQLTKTRNSIGKYKQVDSNETLLNDLSHHLNIDKNQPLISNNDTDEEIVDVVTSNVEPFVSYNSTNNFETISEAVRGRKRILDYASDSSSDGDVPTLSNTSKAYEWDTSDDESLDSGEDDVLKHAIIYTTEEATLITKQKMLKLQNLYMEQIDRLHHLLREKRRKYLQSLRKERETLCSIHDQPKETPQERRLYEKLKALNHYHRRNGVEAVLYKKFKEKRFRSAEGYVQKGPHGPVKCIYTEGGVKCGEKIIPCCKYCRKHILEDKKQCLFRACGIEKSGVICQEPVPNIFDDATCVLHISLPVNQKIYTQKGKVLNL
ncbi:KAT8 regulatory NSL complex subunit 2 isoform X2 [Condylostylus longicornis]|uniref:KAT8 regulatory NSL complex subunit 2 isoform X2 n=1 Tax=Condylostylus longicornis TaxID=2530218 RepID=UPI00244DCF42|nr:KAT8 regulatory NSL complex subunit 2 isoform X2 [Condylostylus longicornis]